VDSLLEALADADLVVSCSGARGRAPAGHAEPTEPARPLAVANGLTSLTGENGPEASLGHVLDAAALVRARERAADRAGDEPEPRPLVILDLALHRDVDPRVADVEGVLLFDLATLKAHAPAVAHDVVAQAQDIVDRAARRFEETRLGREADAAVIALLDEAEVRVVAEIETAVARLSAELAAHGTRGPEESDVDVIAREVRKRVHAELHDKIVAVRARATAEARAAEAALVHDAEALTLAASTQRDVGPSGRR
jgi:glutamyl-tRNA reductase